jgi:imidazolonepropionase-like amidohydrolase
MLPTGSLRSFAVAILLGAAGQVLAHLVLAHLVLAHLVLAHQALAQEPPTGGVTENPRVEAPRAGGQRADGQRPASGEANGEGNPGRRQRRAQALVLEAGTVHPVAGPAIQDGVVVLRGERIAAIGPRGSVEIPEGATVRSFPSGHVYPGLIDAETDAYTDNTLRADASLDAGTPLSLDLQLRHTSDDRLVEAGITTAYIAVRTGAAQRGQGAVVRPTAGGFELWPGQERNAVQLRMTQGPQPSHALVRQQQLDGLANLFDGLDEYQKAVDEHQKALTKYQKDFDDYLAFHKKKKDGDKKEGDKPATNPTAPAAPANAEEGQGGERRRPGGPGGGPGGGRRNQGGGQSSAANPVLSDPVLSDHAAAAQFEAVVDALLALAQDPPKQDPPRPTSGGPAPAQGGPAPGSGGEKKDEAKSEDGPKRPTYPKAPPTDPVKAALLLVRDGALALRVEAHRPDEIRAALALQQKYQLPRLVIEQAYGGAPLAGELAQSGAAVVLTELWPGSLPKLYSDFDVLALPQALAKAGVPFAIASGSARRAATLPLCAAAAVGQGLDGEAALRALTLTPAELLGIQKDTGSLQVGKFADVLVTDRPLFASDCRVRLVLSKGKTQFEAP